MEKGRIEFDDPTFREHKNKMMQTCQPFDLSTAFERGWDAHGAKHHDLDDDIDRRCAELEARLEQTEKDIIAPLDMLIFCPSCGLQHVDQPEPDLCKCGHQRLKHTGEMVACSYRADPNSMEPPCGCRSFEIAWDNLPHKSHLCKPEDGGCGLIFRVADFPTNGVTEIKTRGENDTWPVLPL